MLVRYDHGLKAAGLSNMEASPEQEDMLVNYSQGRGNLKAIRCMQTYDRWYFHGHQETKR